MPKDKEADARAERIRKKYTGDLVHRIDEGSDEDKGLQDMIRRMEEKNGTRKVDPEEAIEKTFNKRK
jgi:hypothetical protein